MLILLSGPPGAGKSTVGDKLAYEFPRSVNFSIDDLRNFVKAGHVPPWEDTEQEGQMNLAVDISIDMIRRYVAKNFVVILDNVIDDEVVERYKEHFTDVHAFLLLPRLEVVKARDAGRPADQQMSERVDILHSDLASKKYRLLQVIDSSDQTADETVMVIKNLIQSA